MGGSKRKLDATANPNDDEEDFPRGGNSTLSRAEVEEIKAQADAEFARENAGRRSKRSKMDDAAATLSGNAPSAVLPLNYKRITPGMKLLGAVSEINKDDITIHLPNGLHGFAKSEETSEGCLKDLKQLFQVGQLVICSVLSCEEHSKGNKEIKRVLLSLLPQHFNQELSIDSIGLGQLIVASVKSAEDRGYVLSFGVPKLSGFLRQRDWGDHKLECGEIIHGFVSAIDKKRKVVNLSSSFSMAKEVDVLSFGSLLPGAIANTRVQAVLRNGLLVSFFKFFTGTIDMLHLAEDYPRKELLEIYKEGQRVKARIIYVDMQSKSIGLSVRLVLQEKHVKPPTVAVGDVCENAIIKRVDEGYGILLELPCQDTTVPGYVHISAASDERIEKLSSTFKEETSVKARVTGFRLMDGLASASLKDSSMEGVVSRHSLRAGMLVSGVVEQVHPFGAFVRLGESITALCPLLHMSDRHLLKPNAKFQTGAKLKFRLLRCGGDDDRLSVTHKRTLISSKLPQITRYEDAIEGMTTHGWIQGISEIGCFVMFYNDVKGLAHRSETGIAAGASFHAGQVVKCRVLKADPVAKRLSLSFILGPRLSNLKNEMPRLGGTVAATITSMGEQEMLLEVSLSKRVVPGVMLYQHLCDTPANVETMKPLLRPGYKFGRLLVIDVQETRLVLSAKHSLLSAADSLPSTIEQITPQAVIPGYISSAQSKGCTVQFLGSLSGFVPIRYMSDSYIEDASKVIQIGQSVRAQALEVDFENSKLLLSLKQSMCFSINACLMESFFIEQEKIAQLKELEDENGMEWSDSLEIGKVVDAEIQETKDYGVILSLKDNADVVGFATYYQVNGVVKVGEKVKARILDVVKMEGIVDLGLRKDVFPVEDETPCFQMHQKVEVVIELVKHDYLVLSVPDFDHAIGYASTHDYNTWNIRPHERYRPGQRFNATVYDLGSEPSGGRLLFLLSDAVAAKPADCRISKGKYGVGSVVRGKVKEISSLFMTIDIGDGKTGTVHVTMVSDEFSPGSPFRGFSIGQEVVGRILTLHAGSRKKKRSPSLEVAIKPSVVSETHASADLSSITFETVNAGQLVTCYVQEINDDWLWVLLAPHLRGRLHILDTSDDIEELEKFKERFKIGEAVQCRVHKVDHERNILDLMMRNKTSADQISSGDVLPGRISKVYPGIGGLVVQLTPAIIGKVHVTHLGDTWLDFPEKLFTEGKFVRCKVLDIQKASTPKPAISLSLRPSLGGSGGFESFPSHTGPMCDQIIKSVTDVKVQMELQGFVKVVNEKGCFVTIAPDLDAKILIKNLSDSYVENPSSAFPVGKVVTGRVVNVEPLSRRVEMTLASHVPILRSFSVGDTVTGYVHKVQDYGLLVKLDGSEVVALCHVSQLRDDSAVHDYKPGDKVRVKILKIDEEKHRMSLGMKEASLEETDEEEDAEDMEEGKPARTEADYQMQVDREDDTAAEQLAVDPLEVDFDDDMPDAVEEKPSPMPTEEAVKLTRRQKRRLKEEKEAALRAAEDKLVRDGPPETVDDFEKLVRSSPNSSYVWIKYMAYYLHLTDVEKARAVAERALATINFREDEEKMNVWIAYLNLENSYGSPDPKEAVLKLFQRALTYCDQKKLYLALLGTFERSKQHDMVDEIMKSMIRKFKTSAKVWLRYMGNLLERGLEDKARKAFDQGVASLPRHKHVKFISHCAILEFKSGYSERGRSMLDGVLRNYPKRLDLWSLYIDQEIRLGDSTVIRNLFERVTCLDLPPKKMKFLFKRYLDYEKAHGDEASVEHVKQKAMEYVEKSS